MDLEWTPLHEAVKNNNVEDVESLIKKGTDVNIKAPGLFTPLHVAATYGFVDIAKRLLKSGANVNARDTGGFTPLHVAAVTGQAEIAEILMKNGALISEKTNMRSDPYRSGETAEALAERYGHAEVAEVIRKYSKN